MGLLEYRETEFPLTADCCYLNNAASAPLPCRAAEALRDYAQQREHRHLAYQTGTQEYDLTGVIEVVSKLLRCDTRNIGFVPSTCDGIAAAANSIDWRPGDNVVIPCCEFPGVINPWMNLIPRGIEVRLSPAPIGHVDLNLLLSKVTSTTRAIAVSHVQWGTGFKLDLEALGRFGREHGILTVVDAIQSVGVQPIDVRAAQIDVLVAGSYKWLLGIPGTALFYVSDEALDSLRPDRAGKLNVVSWNGNQPIWQDGGRRFLVGCTADAALCVLEASAKLLLDADVENIHDHTSALVRRLDTGLRAVGLTVTSSPCPEHQSSIVSFTTGCPESDEQALRWLLQHHVIVSRKPAGIRVAPHGYNTLEDVDTFLDAVTRARQCGAMAGC